MDTTPGRVYLSEVVPPPPASKAVHSAIYAALGFFILVLLGTVALCVVSSRKAHAQDAEALNIIGGTKFTITRAAERADRKDQIAAARRDKQRLVKREKELEERLDKVAKTVRIPAPTLAKEHSKQVPVKVGKEGYQSSAITSRKSSLPRAHVQSQTPVKRKKSVLQEKGRQKLELEIRKDRDKVVKKGKSSKRGAKDAGDKKARVKAK